MTLIRLNLYLLRTNRSELLVFIMSMRAQVEEMVSVLNVDVMVRVVSFQPQSVNSVMCEMLLYALLSESQLTFRF